VIGGPHRSCDYHSPAFPRTEARIPFDINREAPAVAERQVVVDAPPERVWFVLTEIDAWPQWQGSVSRAELEGPLEPGSTFRWKAGGLSIVSTLRVVEPPHSVAWEGRARGLYARHRWTLERTDGRTTVNTAESFEGPLVRLLRPLMRRALERGLEGGLAELKEAAQAGV
jgi:uncharacterized protein YndB with AHSA1/START domain